MPSHAGHSKDTNPGRGLRDEVIVFAITVGVGVLSSLGVWLYRHAIDLFHATITHYRPAGVWGALTLIVVLALTGLLVGWLISRFNRDDPYRGVAGIMECVSLGDGRLRYRQMPVKALASALSLGAGASVGPEGPSAEIGANLGSFLGERLKINRHDRRLMLAAGAAGGIATAFNAPLAGIVFALEIVLQRAFNTRGFALVAMASVASVVVIRNMEPLPYVYDPDVHNLQIRVDNWREMPLYVLLAFILAPVAFFTVRTMAFQHLVWERFARLPAPLRTALAGAALGVVGLMLPQVLGDGREPMRAVFDGEVRFGALFLVTLGIAKILATGFSQAGGFVGGTFTPLVATGIFIGAGFGQLFQSFGLGALSDPQVFAIVGMAGMLSGVIRAPVTAALLAFEMTQDAALVMPILLTVIICLLVTRRLTPLGLYATELLSRGSNVHQLRYINLVRSLTEDSELGVSRRTIDATASVDELRAVLDEEPTDAILVVDATGHLSGLVTSADLARGLAENPGEQLTVADLYAKFETR